VEVQYFGANCVRIQGKGVTVVVDDNLESLGEKAITKPGDIVLVTNPMVRTTHNEAKIVIDMPGEYEVSNVSIHGVAARAHMDEEDKQTATIFKIVADDIRLVVVGHVYPELSDHQLEALGTVDILVIPVGGNGYTLDGVGALKLIKKIEPKLVVPTHYADKSLKYEVPQQSLDEAVKALAMEPKETVAKLKVKPVDLTDNTQLVVLEK
jgi:L-ascorbate metabolism protein UlaG (beta-lactamase superfamily)